MQLFPGSGRALTTNGMELSLVAPVGLYCGVSASTDLVHWVAFTNVLTTNAVTPLLDGAAVNYKSRFYRAWLP